MPLSALSSAEGSSISTELKDASRSCGRLPHAAPKLSCERLAMVMWLPMPCSRRLAAVEEPTRPLPPRTRMRLFLTADRSMEGAALLDEGVSVADAVAADAVHRCCLGEGRARWGDAMHAGIVCGPQQRGALGGCIRSCLMVTCDRGWWSTMFVVMQSEFALRHNILIDNTTKHTSS